MPLVIYLLIWVLSMIFITGLRRRRLISQARDLFRLSFCTQRCCRATKGDKPGHRVLQPKVHVWHVVETSEGSGSLALSVSKGSHSSYPDESQDRAHIHEAPAQVTAYVSQSTSGTSDTEDPNKSKGAERLKAPREKRFPPRHCPILPQTQAGAVRQAESSSGTKSKSRPSYSLSRSIHPGDSWQEETSKHQARGVRPVEGPRLSTSEDSAPPEKVPTEPGYIAEGPCQEPAQYKLGPGEYILMPQQSAGGMRLLLDPYLGQSMPQPQSAQQEPPQQGLIQQKENVTQPEPADVIKYQDSGYPDYGNPPELKALDNQNELLQYNFTGLPWSSEQQPGQPSDAYYTPYSLREAPLSPFCAANPTLSPTYGSYYYFGRNQTRGYLPINVQASPSIYSGNFMNQLPSFLPRTQHSTFPYQHGQFVVGLPNPEEFRRPKEYHGRRRQAPLQYDTGLATRFVSVNPIVISSVSLM